MFGLTFREAKSGPLQTPQICTAGKIFEQLLEQLAVHPNCYMLAKAGEFALRIPLVEQSLEQLAVQPKCYMLVKRQANSPCEFLLFCLKKNPTGRKKVGKKREKSDRE